MLRSWRPLDRADMEGTSARRRSPSLPDCCAPRPDSRQWRSAP
jgi:hypothetical protein